jgi:hypothetical protein
MAFNTSNPVVLGRATRKSHYDRVFDNTIAIKEARVEHELGGHYASRLDDTSLVAIPHPVIARLDGTNLGGFTVEVLCTAYVETGTGEIRLYNLTTASYVSSVVTFTNTAIAVVTITGITLTTGLNNYVLHGRGQSAAALPTIYGARLVVR